MLCAVNRCDVVITSGGVSMGEADYVKTILQEIGTVHFGRLNMKPGKPTTFASINRGDGGKSYFFGLPGNPVSCLVCKALVVDPALKRLQGVQSKGRKISDCCHLLTRLHARSSYCHDNSKLSVRPISPRVSSVNHIHHCVLIVVEYHWALIPPLGHSSQQALEYKEVLVFSQCAPRMPCCVCRKEMVFFHQEQSPRRY